MPHGCRRVKFDFVRRTHADDQHYRPQGYPLIEGFEPFNRLGAARNFFEAMLGTNLDFSVRFEVNLTSDDPTRNEEPWIRIAPVRAGNNHIGPGMARSWHDLITTGRGMCEYLVEKLEQRGSGFSFGRILTIMMIFTPGPPLTPPPMPTRPS